MVYAKHMSEKDRCTRCSGDFCKYLRVSDWCLGLETCYSFFGAASEVSAPVPNYFLSRVEAAFVLERRLVVELTAIPYHADNEINPQG